MNNQPVTITIKKTTAENAEAFRSLDEPAKRRALIFYAKELTTAARHSGRTAEICAAIHYVLGEATKPEGCEVVFDDELFAAPGDGIALSMALLRISNEEALASR